MTDTRLLTYNIHGLRDDADAVSAVMRACAADVVCVQEAPRFMRWRSKRAAIARKAGLVVATADRPAGLMILVSMRTQVVSTSFTLLPKSPNLHQRAVCSATLRVAGLPLTVASVHLSLDDGERQVHLPELWAALPSEHGSLVVAGDVNEGPDGPVWRDLSTGDLRDAWTVAGTGDGHTFSATSPHKRIDGVFVGAAFDVVECRAVDVPGVERASDHLPVLAVLRAAGRQGRT